MEWRDQKAKARCPYYETHSYPRQGTCPSISCEKPDTIGGKELRIVFNVMQERDSYMDRYCIGDFKHCRMYQIITKEEGYES